jgi:predicted anti-sigma-YlaC factor YlaD
MKHLSEDELILLHYGESKGRAAEAHLAACEQCRSQLHELTRVLKMIEPPQEPARSEQYGGEVWDRIRAALPERQPGWREQMLAWWRRPQAWAAAGVVATLVVAAFLAGQYWSRGPDPTTAGTTTPPPAAEKVRERVLLFAVGSHLERSQMVLVEIANAPAADGLDISQEQRRAQELISANRLYRQTAAETGDASVAGVLNQLESVLMEIAHRPSKLNKAEVERLQKQIESRGLIFKIRVVESNVRSGLRKRRPEPQTPATTLPRTTT